MEDQTNSSMNRSALDRGLLSSTTDTNGVVQRIATYGLSQTHKQDVEYDVSRKDVSIRASLNSLDRGFLTTEVYPYLNLKFLATSGSLHGLANARRVIESEIAISKCSKQQRVVDIGGNFHLYIVMGRENFHCCCPLLGVRDAQRLTNRLSQLESWVRDALSENPVPKLDQKEAYKRENKKARALKFKEDPGQFYCRRLGVHSRAELPLGGM
ncbi:Vmethyltransf-domain-containing protein [Lophiostoma macrostomum CBS 122681]|uniref:Vmethyltransf-domain-containing protein n=1 Tax=Lophiostoma macrostomum CBS 122681 TaxID=1314788 RepID=A0A6A6T0W7_9PLEO|nr:Vmethyltransf-domain-containing protein [Lophiostoma macrostomum CBS 122681]